eukprot:scaffold36312_cov155-Skeletonema_dohrnii-CCMP3373.AAC.2
MQRFTKYSCSMHLRGRTRSFDLSVTQICISSKDENRARLALRDHKHISHLALVRHWVVVSVAQPCIDIALSHKLTQKQLSSSSLRYSASCPRPSSSHNNIDN